MLVIRRCYLLLILAGLFFVVVQALLTTNRPLLSASSLSTSSSLVSKKYQPLLFAFQLQKVEEMFVDGKNNHNHNHKSMDDDDIAVSDVLGQPLYEMAGIDLSSAWITLVRRNKVSATLELPVPIITKTVIDADADTNENNTNEEESGEERNSIRVEYGVRMIQCIDDEEDASITTLFPKEDEENCQSSKKPMWILEEYVQQLAGRGGKEANRHPLIRAMNTTLIQIQQQQSKNRENTNINVSKRVVGNFVAQLQLIRTLRPPPSKELLQVQADSPDTTICTSTPPLYDPATDSFVTGALRLQLRPLVCQLGVDGESDGVNDDDDGNGQPPHHVSLTTTTTTTTTTTPWDVYHNVSPIDRRGHFLLLPTLSMRDKNKNWRAQSLTRHDCSDLVRLASSIEPVGSLFLGYNSIGAGASQNHIHCHAWPYPLSTTTIGATTIPSNDDNDHNNVIRNIKRSISSTTSNSVNHNHDHNHNHNHECTNPDHDHGVPQHNNNNNNNNKYYDGNYAVTKVDSIYDYYDVIKKSSSSSSNEGDTETEDETENDIAVEVSYLNYPVFCVLLSSTVDNLHWLGKAIDNCLQTIESVASGAAPHNVGLLNRVVDIDDDIAVDVDDVISEHDQLHEDDDDRHHKSQSRSITYVDAYIFVRSKEQSTTFLPTMKLGISEMMGVFQAQSEEELHRLTQTTAMVEFVIDDDDGTSRIERKNKSLMEQVLLDVSFGSSGRARVHEDDRENERNDHDNNAEDDDDDDDDAAANDLWEKIVTNLAAMDVMIQQ